jgi:hypothetical protein
VTVVVTDPTGLLIPRALVAFSQSSNRHEPKLETDGHGRATTALTPGDYALRVEVPGFKIARESVHVTGPAEEVPVTLALAEGCPPCQRVLQVDSSELLTTEVPVLEVMAESAPAPAAGYKPVTLMVKDQTGWPISTSAVQVFPRQDGSDPGIKADADGRTALSLQPGQYDLRVFGRGYEVATEHVSVAGALTVPVVLRIGTVSGPVEVIPGPDPFQTEAAPVTAMIQSAPAPPHRQPIVPVTVTMRTVEIATKTNPITAMIQSAPAPAPGYTPVTVVVTDSSGAAVPGAEIRVTPGSPAGDRLITDERGQVQLGMPAGKYQLEVSAQGFTSNKGALIVVDKPQTLTVTLTPAPSSSGVPVSAGPAPMQPGAVPLETTIDKPHAEGASESGTEVPGGAASANRLVIIGTGGLRGVFTLATLLQYPQTTVTIHDHHTNADETYSGVPLIDLLAKLGVPHGADLKGKALGTYVVATGSDGYKSVVALGELDPEFHPGTVLIADTMDGKPLDKAGPFRLVVTEDKRPARSVRNLVRVEVRTAE